MYDLIMDIYKKLIEELVSTTMIKLKNNKFFDKIDEK